MQRNTIQRTLICEAVNEMKCHATADAIYELINKTHPTISRATVYRNLNQLSDNGEIQKMEVPGGPVCFDHRCIKHYHAKCVKCGKIFDVNMDYMIDLEKTITKSHGFKFSGHDIMFTGTCTDCTN